MAASICLAEHGHHCHPLFNHTHPSTQPHNHDFLMSTTPRNNSWREVTWPGVVPLRSVYSNGKSSMTSLPLKPSVLSFSNLLYTDKTFPLLVQPLAMSTTTTNIVHPFQGIAIILTQCTTTSDRQQHHPLQQTCYTSTNDCDYVTDSKNDSGMEGNHVDTNKSPCVSTESPQETRELPHETAVCDQQVCDYDYNTDKEGVLWEGDCDTSDDECDSSECDICEESEDDDCVIDFLQCDTCGDNKTTKDTLHKMSPAAPTPPPCTGIVLNHTFSFSSEESGFHDISPNTVDWLDDDSDDDDIDDDIDDNDDRCNEGLWQDFEQKACFSDIPMKSCSSKSSPSTSNHGNQHHQSDDANKHRSTCTLNFNSLFTGSSRSLCSTDNNARVADTQDAAGVTANQRDGRKKRVRFMPDCKLVVVHYMVTWKFAYRACRRGPWEQYAVDRERFNKRIHTVESVLTPCLNRKLSQQKVKSS